MFKTWIGFVGQILIKLETSFNRGFLQLPLWCPLGNNVCKHSVTTEACASLAGCCVVWRSGCSLVLPAPWQSLMSNLARSGGTSIADMRQYFLTVTKQLYEWLILPVCPPVRLSHLVPFIASSWNFQELLPMTKVRSMQTVMVGGERSRSQRSKPNLTVSGP